MAWNEGEHPRDEIGRFTSKGGGEEEEEGKQEKRKEKKKGEKTENSQDGFSDIKPFKLGAEYNDVRIETPAQVLYGKNSKTSKDISIQKERNKLINKLGDKLTPKQVLYSSLDELKEMIEKSTNSAAQKSTEFAIGKRHSPIFNNIIKLGVGKDTAGMLDIAHGDKMNDKTYLKDTIELKNYDDPAVNSDKNYLEEKITQQFKDYGFDIRDIKGYFFKNNSEPSKRISQNEDFKNILKNNKEAIVKGKNFSGRFEKHGDKGIFNNNDLKNALGGFDVRHPYFDKEGNLHLKIYDTYDFNKNAKDFLNKAGRHEMEAGNLEPYFSIHDIIISKEEIEEILK